MRVVANFELISGKEIIVTLDIVRHDDDGDPFDLDIFLTEFRDKIMSQKACFSGIDAFTGNGFIINPVHVASVMVSMVDEP